VTNPPQNVQSQGRKSASGIVSVEASFSGPLPPPAILRGYEEVCPGSAQRILAMAEQQGDHRKKMEEKAVDAAVEEMRRGFSEARSGQVCAVIVALSFIAGGVYVAVIGSHPWQGALLGGGGVGLQALISVFIKGRDMHHPNETPSKSGTQPSGRKAKKS
jgi:uncharacterized membrane protein